MRISLVVFFCCSLSLVAQPLYPPATTNDVFNGTNRSKFVAPATLNAWRTNIGAGFANSSLGGASNVFLLSTFVHSDATLPSNGHFLQLEYSTDGTNFNSLGTNRQNYFLPTTNGYRAAYAEVRDPSIAFIHGKWRMVYTHDAFSGSTLNAFGYADSVDGLTWTNQTVLIASNAGTSAIRIYGPEWFVDDSGNAHIIFGQHNDALAWYVRCADHTCTNLTDLTLLITPAVHLGDISVQDLYLTRHNGTNYLACISSVNYILQSTSLTNGYTITATLASTWEGLSLVSMGTNRWRLYGDIAGQSLMYGDSTNLINWTSQALPTSYTGSHGHGTVVRITNPAWLQGMTPLLDMKRNAWSDLTAWYANQGLRGRVTQPTLLSNGTYTNTPFDSFVLFPTNSVRTNVLLDLGLYPRGTYDGFEVTIKDTGSAGGTAGAGSTNIFVRGARGALIDGATTFAIATNYGAASFVAIGTNWFSTKIAK